MDHPDAQKEVHPNASKPDDREQIMQHILNFANIQTACEEEVRKKMIECIANIKKVLGLNEDAVDERFLTKLHDYFDILDTDLNMSVLFIENQIFNFDEILDQPIQSVWLHQAWVCHTEIDDDIVLAFPVFPIRTAPQICFLPLLAIRYSSAEEKASVCTEFVKSCALAQGLRVDDATSAKIKKFFLKSARRFEITYRGELEDIRDVLLNQFKSSNSPLIKSTVKELLNKMINHFFYILGVSADENIDYLRVTRNYALQNGELLDPLDICSDCETEQDFDTEPEPETDPEPEIGAESESKVEAATEAEAEAESKDD
ncbi:unnamed protein product [Caenorhabditis sp. 36 PRJEB53466]|nr:unnamed protein product [Caenorhabditis sp. 36 PRJEB53466]